jgi:PadR family transcriptional regulator, regulatory protein PadR
MAVDKKLLKGSTAMLILRLLKAGDKYGYQLVRELEQRSNNVFTLKEGTLYPILHALESKGQIESYWQQSESNRRRRYYHITDEGTRFLHERQQEWETFSQGVNQVLRGATDAG